MLTTMEGSKGSTVMLFSFLSPSDDSICMGRQKGLWWPQSQISPWLFSLQGTFSALLVTAYDLGALFHLPSYLSHKTSCFPPMWSGLLPKGTSSQTQFQLLFGSECGCGIYSHLPFWVAANALEHFFLIQEDVGGTQRRPPYPATRQSVGSSGFLRMPGTMGCLTPVRMHSLEYGTVLMRSSWSWLSLSGTDLFITLPRNPMGIGYGNTDWGPGGCARREQYLHGHLCVSPTGFPLLQSGGGGWAKITRGPLPWPSLPHLHIQGSQQFISAPPSNSNSS